MNNNQLAEAAKILGVSEDSIFAMDDEIKNSMTAVFEQVAVKKDVDKKSVFEAKVTAVKKQQGCLYQEIWTYCKTEKDPDAVRNHGKLSE